MDIENPVRENEDILTDEEAAERAAKKAAAREARQKKKQKSKVIKTVLLAVLAFIFVLVAACVGFVVYLQGQGGEYDNITECVQSEPMPFEQRYSFSAADKSASIKLDKNDIWWLIYQSGAIERLEKLDAALGAGNTRLSGMGISTDTGALCANVELTCFGKVKLPLIATCAVDYTDTDVVISVADVKLANGWGVPLRWLCARFDSDPSALTLSISRSIHPRLNDIRGFSFADGALIANCGVGEDIYSEALPNVEAIKDLKRFGLESPAIDAVIEAADGTGTAAIDAAFASFEANPNAFTEFRTSALSLADEAAAAEYMSGPYSAYVQHFLPALSLDTLSTAKTELFGISTERSQLLETLAGNLNTAYTKGTITEPESDDKDKEDDKENTTAATTAKNFINTAVEDKPALTMEQLAGTNWAQYSEWITEADMRVVYLTSFPNTTVEVTPEDDKDSKKKDDDEEAKTVTTPAKPVGLLVRMKDASFRLYYFEAALAEGSTTQVAYTIASIELDAITGETYMAAETIPSAAYVAPAAASIPVEVPAAEPTEPAAPAAETPAPEAPAA